MENKGGKRRFEKNTGNEGSITKPETKVREKHRKRRFGNKTGNEGFEKQHWKRKITVLELSWEQFPPIDNSKYYFVVCLCVGGNKKRKRKITVLELSWEPVPNIGNLKWQDECDLFCSF